MTRTHTSTTDAETEQLFEILSGSPDDLGEQHATMAGAMTRFDPISPDGLVELCAELAAEAPGRRVITVDGADAATPTTLAQAVADRLVTGGRAAAVVSMSDFLRPASLRLEYGHTDPESYGSVWFDHAAVSREVVDAVHTRGRWLPRLWDTSRDRSFRDSPMEASVHQVILLAGPLLLGSGIDVDASIALMMSEAALRRRTPSEDAWTIPALVRHADTAPTPDIAVRFDHPERPAVSAS